MEPAVTTLTFSVIVPPAPEGGTATTNAFIDLSQCASLVNRRFYRQGINWAVAGMKFLSNTGLSASTLDGSISVLKLPQTWTMSNSWMKGFAAWQRMNDDALEETESVRPRFLDFKIFADAEHHAAGFNANLLPISNAAVAATAGEWESSKVVIPTSTTTSGVSEFELIATGASFPGAGASTLNAVSLIEGYAASRGLPAITDPNTPGDADDVGPTATPENWLGSMFNEGTDQDKTVLDDMITENNQAPYPYENAQIPGAAPGTVFGDTQYPGGANQLSGMQIHDVEFVTGTTIGGTTRLKGGMFPCGLIRLRLNNGDETSSLVHTFTVDLVPGHHRGYLCEPMTEM